MKRSRFSEEHVIGILKGREAGVAVATCVASTGTSSTFYSWKAKFGDQANLEGGL